MSMTMVAGRDDGFHEGIQNNPVVGAQLPPVDILVDDEYIRDYVNSVGDEGFWAFSARMQAMHSLKLAPTTIFDRDIGARLVGISARFALHAKQEFRFHGPIVPGEVYRLSGEVVDVTNRRGIDYFTTRALCAPLRDPSSVRVESLYTRAYRFPDNQYVKRERQPIRIGTWLYDNMAMPRNAFPEVGSIVEGRTTLLDQARLNLYSGPGSGVHTDNLVARRGGLNGTVAQGLMATELECELYRDLFGLNLVKGGEVRASYVQPIPCGVELRALCVVESVEDDLITLKSAVATTSGDVVSVGKASIKNWRDAERF